MIVTWVRGLQELTKAQKRDVGASLVWSELNSINGHLEQLDQKYLEMTRILLEHKRRLDTFGITVDHHRKILSKSDTEVNMWCISCRHEFKVSRQDAEAQEYTVTCSKCGSWALLKDQIPQEFSIRDIARISGFAYSTVSGDAGERSKDNR
jgi:DNA-directed RNA polymerase subunit RPC12/RpoP